MNGTVREWAEKAEGDFNTAGREMRAQESPNYDAVCFHSQQCVEKLMKGLLIDLGVVPPKTHDLAHLDQLLSSACPDWTWDVDELRFLSRSSVDARYPGESANQERAREALRLCGRLRQKLLSLLGQNP